MLIIATAKSKHLAVKTGDLNPDFQKSATSRDTVGNSSFNLGWDVGRVDLLTIMQNSVESLF